MASIAALAAAAAAMVAAPGSQGDLAGRYAAGQQRANELQSAVRAETDRIRGFEGTISSLQSRLGLLERSVAIQERQLSLVRGELGQARSRLHELQGDYARDQQILAAQLRADYESPPPTLVDVVVDARGFQDLLNGVSSLKAIERQNARAIIAVDAARHAVAGQTRQLARVQARQERATAAVVVERDQVAQLRLSIVNRELVTQRARSRDAARLSGLQRTLTREAVALDRQAASAQAAASGGAAPAPGACVNTPFVAHGGPYGFFPAPGTDYSVGQEPIIAARLDALGRALQLHLIGISGYRSPQHSMEVGGFADDPHTRGEASDTPGVEGVPEATLESYCLTRPFAGAREADHIQEL